MIGLLEQLVNGPSIGYLARGLAASSLRQEVISNNMANVNTPNFKRSEVRFEDMLAKELALDDGSGRMQVVRTHDRHLPIRPIGTARPIVEEDGQTTMRVDKNNVDIDIEMASLAKNQLYYNAMATELGSYVSRLKGVITSTQG
ncbi:flagellar basal-body rod protein FlgB [Mitsuokella sp. oral taxon 131 str. W9106]|nr:flagellar basal-body rod protein FlgB [Mitsuokella sp. oral taxon 131 str. W9106]